MKYKGNAVRDTPSPRSLVFRKMTWKEMAMANFKAGDVVNLPMGWKLEFCSTREGDGQDALQGFVAGPRGASASLACALETGATSGSDERPIPSQVLKTLEQYESYQ